MAGLSRICPWWLAPTLDNPIRRLVHNPEKILGRLIEEGDTVLDLGCGSGTFTIAMAKMAGVDGRVIAVDLQDRMLQLLRKKAAKEGLSSRITTHRGEVISGLRADLIVRRGVGYVPQERNIFPSLSARENFEMGAFIKRDLLDKGLEEVLRIFPEIKGRMDQKVGTMSGGEQKMVAIGRALVAEPALLLLDEPSSALSPKLVDQVFSKVVEINEMGTAIMMVEQNAKKALAISDQGYVLEMGRNRYEGPGRTLLEDADVRGLYLGG